MATVLPRIDNAERKDKNVSAKDEEDVTEETTVNISETSKENVDREGIANVNDNTIKQSHPSVVSRSSKGRGLIPSIKVAPSDKVSLSVTTTSNPHIYNVPSFMMEKSRHIDANIRKSIFKTATKEREENRFAWPTNFDYSLVSVACVVGITNLLQFPQMCKKYGGMAFFIPYLLVVACMGLPLYFLETLLGQYSGHGTVAVMNELVPAFVGVGYALVITNFVSFMRNEVGLARLLYFILTTMKSTIPWAVCQEQNSIGCYTKVDDIYCGEKFGNNSVFFNLTCTSITAICEYLNMAISTTDGRCQANNGSLVWYNSVIERTTPNEEFNYHKIFNMEGATLSHLGPIQWPMFFCLALCWAFTYLLGYNGFSTTRKSAYLTVFAPLFGHAIIFCKAFTLDGAGDGIRTYLSFDASSLAYEAVWQDAIRTCFISLSLGLGLITAISSASKPYKNCLKTTMAIICIDTVFSFASGLGMFALMGHLAHVHSTTVEELMAEQPDVMFATLPIALNSLEFPRVYVVISYVSTVLMSFGYLASVIAMTTYDGKDIFNSVTSIADDGDRNASNLSIYQYNIITCVLGFTVSIMFVAKGGTLILDVTDVTKHIDISFVIASLQAMVICLFYGSGSLLDLVESEMGIKLGWMRPYWALTWNITAPALLFWSAFSVASTEIEAGQHRAWHVFSSVFAFYPLLIVLGFFVFKVYQYRHSGVRKAFHPTKKWCLGLDTGLLIDAEMAEPEVWKAVGLLAVPQAEPMRAMVAPRIDLQQDHSTTLPLSIASSEVPQHLSKLNVRAKSMFNGRRAQALISHTLRGNSYVPFERQKVEGERIRKSVTVPNGESIPADEAG